MDPRGNIVLIGMPGVGKSTLGVLLAKAAGTDFVDTDVVIQAREGRSLQTIIDADGLEAFRAIEERVVLGLDCRNTVVATGGSVVYGAAAMAHLAASGRIVHLYLPLPALQRRLANFAGRGVVIAPGESLETLFAAREPLYRRYAERTVDCTGLSHEAAVAAVLRQLRAPGSGAAPASGRG